MNSSDMFSVWIPLVSALGGTIVGGAITYFTVRQQLQHASSEARLTREHALKREVYLEAAEGFAAGLEYLLRICRSDLTLQELSDTPKSAWTYRIHAVGDLNTIKAVDLAGEELTARGLDLMAKRMRWETVRSAAAELHERIEALGTRGEQLVAAVQALSASGATPEALARAAELTGDIQAVHAELTELAREWRQASKCRDKAHRDMAVAGMVVAARYPGFLSQAMIHLRRELGLPVDEVEYRRHIEEMSVRSAARIKELTQLLNELESQ